MVITSASGRKLTVVPGRTVIHFRDGAIQEDIYTADTTFEAGQWAAFKNRNTGPNRMFLVVPE